MVLLQDQTVRSFGANARGCLGLSNAVTSFATATPQALATTGMTSVSKVVAGASNAAAITSSGILYVWGDNAAGQLGTGSLSPEYMTYPVQLAAPDGSGRIIDSTTSTVGACVVLASSDGMAWTLVGSGSGFTGSAMATIKANAVPKASFFRMVVTNGSAGIGVVAVREMAVYGSYLCEAYPIAVCCGSQHSVVHMANNTIRTFGNNASSQLRTNTDTNAQWTFVPRKPICAFGTNAKGALGDGTTTVRYSPVALNLVMNAAGATNLFMFTRDHGRGWDAKHGCPGPAGACDGAQILDALRDGRWHDHFQGRVQCCDRCGNRQRSCGRVHGRDLSLWLNAMTCNVEIIIPSRSYHCNHVKNPCNKTYNSWGSN